MAVSAAALLLAATFAAADDDVEYAESRDDEGADYDGGVGTGETIQVRFYASLPNAIVAGEQAHALVGVENIHHQPVTVMMLTAAIAQMYDPSTITRNLSFSVQNRTVHVKERATLHCNFTFPDDMDSREWILVIRAYFFPGDGTPLRNLTYLGQAYNSTIHVAPPNSSFDAASAFLVLMLAGILAALGYAAYVGCKSRKPSRGHAAAVKTRAPAAASTAAGTGEAAGGEGVDWDYVPKHHQHILKKGSASPGKASGTKASGSKAAASGSKAASASKSPASPAVPSKGDSAAKASKPAAKK